LNEKTNPSDLSADTYRRERGEEMNDREYLVGVAKRRKSRKVVGGDWYQKGWGSDPGEGKKPQENRTRGNTIMSYSTASHREAVRKNSGISWRSAAHLERASPTTEGGNLDWYKTPSKSGKFVRRTAN